MSRRLLTTGSIYAALKSNRSYLSFDELNDKQTCVGSSFNQDTTQEAQEAQVARVP
jgi:hypothetical protein